MYLPREEGQGWFEYALVILLIAIVLIAVIELVGPQVVDKLKELGWIK